MSKYVELTDREASMLLSNWGSEHFEGNHRCVCVDEVLNRRDSVAIIHAWGGRRRTTSNLLASIIRIRP